MRLLLDTHLLLWTLTGSEAMPARARTLIGDDVGGVVVSVISIWEIAVKYALRRGRMNDMPLSGSDALAETMAAGFDMLAVTGAHAAALDALPLHHGDPFDRLLIAQAAAESLKLLTHDVTLAAYGDHVIVV